MVLGRGGSRGFVGGRVDLGGRPRRRRGGPCTGPGRMMPQGGGRGGGAAGGRIWHAICSSTLPSGEPGRSFGRKDAQKKKKKKARVQSKERIMT